MQIAELPSDKLSACMKASGITRLSAQNVYKNICSYKNVRQISSFFANILFPPVSCGFRFILVRCESKRWSPILDYIILQVCVLKPGVSDAWPHNLHVLFKNWRLIHIQKRTHSINIQLNEFPDEHTWKFCYMCMGNNHPDSNIKYDKHPRGCLCILPDIFFSFPKVSTVLLAFTRVLSILNFSIMESYVVCTLVAAFLVQCYIYDIHP